MRTSPDTKERADREDKKFQLRFQKKKRTTIRRIRNELVDERNEFDKPPFNKWNLINETSYKDVQLENAIFICDMKYL